MKAVASLFCVGWVKPSPCHIDWDWGKDDRDWGLTRIVRDSDGVTLMANRNPAEIAAVYAKHMNNRDWLCCRVRTVRNTTGGPLLPKRVARIRSRDVGGPPRRR